MANPRDPLEIAMEALRGIRMVSDGSIKQSPEALRANDIATRALTAIEAAQAAQRNPLSQACPECTAPPGKSCKLLTATAPRKSGDPRRPHRARVEAAQAQRGGGGERCRCAVCVGMLSGPGIECRRAAPCTGCGRFTRNRAPAQAQCEGGRTFCVILCTQQNGACPARVEWTGDLEAPPDGWRYDDDTGEAWCPAHAPSPAVEPAAPSRPDDTLTADCKECGAPAGMRCTCDY